MGLLLLSWLWLGPLADMARRALSPHMLLHLGVMVAAAPLIVIGISRLLPDIIRPRRPLHMAIAASVFELVVVWGWHAPSMHDAAARWGGVFALQQFTFLLAGTALWWACFTGRGAKEMAIGAVAMLFTSMHMTMLGVLLVISPTLIYSPQFCLGAFGLEPLADQRFSGGIMVLLGALPFVVAGALLASRLASMESFPLEAPKQPDRE